MFSRLLCDHGGEFTGARFDEAMQGLGVKVVRNSPETKAGAAHQEVAVKTLSHGTKSILLENNLPADMWEEAATSGANTANLCSSSKNAKTKDGDGDCPLSTITCGNISRKMCRGYLKACVRIGSPCLFFDGKTLGSDVLQCHTRLGWMYAVRSEGKMTLFRDPDTGAMTRSRSFIEYDLPDHENFLDFFRKPLQGGGKGFCFEKDKDEKDAILVIDQLAEVMATYKPKAGTYTVAHAVNAPVPHVFHVDQGTGRC